MPPKPSNASASHLKNHAFILELGQTPQIPNTMYLRTALFTIISCNRREPAVVFAIWELKDKDLRQERVYIRAHDPRVCRCINLGLDYVIQPQGGRRDLGVEMSELDLGGPEKGSARVQGHSSNTAGTLSSANIFNSIYFARADGSFQNALGHRIVQDDGKDDYRDSTKFVRLRDLLGVGKLIPGPMPKYPERLVAMFHWSVEVL